MEGHRLQTVVAVGVGVSLLGVLIQWYFNARNISKKTVVRIFDFDGTIFKSPLPSKKMWSNSLLGKIMTPPHKVTIFLS